MILQYNSQAGGELIKSAVNGNARKGIEEGKKENVKFSKKEEAEEMVRKKVIWKNLLVFTFTC